MKTSHSQALKSYGNFYNEYFCHTETALCVMFMFDFEKSSTYKYELPKKKELDRGVMFNYLKIYTQ